MAILKISLKKIWQFWIFFNELNICMFIWSALESFPTTSHLLSRFFHSFLFPFTFSLFPPVLTLLTEGQSYCGGNFSFGCFCLHASLVGQSKNLVKGTFLLLTTGCRGEWMNKCGRWAVGEKKKKNFNLLLKFACGVLTLAGNVAYSLFSLFLYVCVFFPRRRQVLTQRIRS